jgi:O-acetyl-ADP-ribose deacetylase (regulator of RNase III)
MSHQLHIGDALVVIKRGDITAEDTDAVVNAANSSLLGGGGVDGAIHRAGGPAILEECKRIVERVGRCPTGEAVITTGGNLPARHVIHTVGPVWRGDPKDATRLANAYRNSLALATEHGLDSVSFPSISTGAYRYPIEAACEVALRTVFEELPRTVVKEVRFVLFSESDLDVYLDKAPSIAREFGAT